jgi:hypothetical protein
MPEWLAGVVRTRLLPMGGALALCVAGWSSRAAAQTCGAGSNNSCMSITFAPVKSTPDASDFAIGLSVIGRFTVSVIKCGRPPCTVTAAAGNQPTGGLRVHVGGTPPLSLADCTIDLSGVTTAQSGQAPVLAVVTGAATVTVWVCRALSWNPLTTAIGVSSPEMRFRLRQS